MTQRHPDAAALDRFRTGELPEAERASVAAHVAGCETCAGALAELESFAAAVARAYAADRTLASAEEPDWARARARIAEGTAASGVGSGPVEVAGREGRARRPAWARWVPQAAAAVVALLVLGVLWREGVQGPEDARRIAEPRVPSVADRAPEAAPESDVARTETQAGRDAADLRAQAREPAEQDARRRDAPAAAPETLAGGVAQREEQAAAEALRAEDRAVAEDRAADPLRAADEDRANQAAKVPPPSARMAEAAALDPRDRFAIQAREALAGGDTLSARRTLALWRDTLAPRDELDPALRRQAEALADSLAALLAALPD